MCCGAWSAPGAVIACCTWHVCWLYVCVVVVLGSHLVYLHLSYVLAICVYCCAWSTPGAVYVLAICIVRYLART